MKTEDLKAKGLSQEQIDFVMAENGKDVNGIKQERDNYKGQLDTAQTTLKSFEGVDITDLQGKITQLTSDLAKKDTTYQAQLAERDFYDRLKEIAASYKPRDIKAVTPFLDIEKLKESKNQENDMKAAFETAKKEKGYLFQDVAVPRVVSVTPGPNQNTDDAKTKANEALRNILGRK